MALKARYAQVEGRKEGPGGRRSRGTEGHGHYRPEWGPAVGMGLQPLRGQGIWGRRMQASQP